MSDKIENCTACGVDVSQDEHRHGIKGFVKKEITGKNSSNSNFTNSQLLAKEQEITELREELTKLKQEIEQLKKIPVSNVEEKEKKEERINLLQNSLKTKSEQLGTKSQEIQQISRQTNQNSGESKIGIWIGLGIAGVVIIGIMAYFLGRKSRK